MYSVLPSFASVDTAMYAWFSICATPLANHEKPISPHHSLHGHWYLSRDMECRDWTPSPQHQVCLLASERHAQLASFMLSIIIIACVVIEESVYQNK
uniref:Secreted protein n=1 Tax=Angiostrongylus cantonensis TaxID=6313 RepID=A0A0K0DHV2_ANGCA